MTTDELLKAKQAALLLNVTPETLARWRKEGKIAYIGLPSGQYRYPKSEIIKMLERGKA